MASLVQLFNEWEIQMLVLLSFLLQAFLFIGGGLRRRTSNGFLRLLVWIAYVGADLVAAYALGLISRQDAGDGGGSGMGSRRHHQQLVFMWAPFLLIHLGGQDTITAFSLEDNNLWRRHLLNLTVQVTLTLYILYKSANNGRNTKLLASTILVFVTGTIKYGERTWALRSGVLRTLGQSPLPHYAAQLKETHLDDDDDDDSFSEAGVLSVALLSIESALGFLWDKGSHRPIPDVWDKVVDGQVLPLALKSLEIELSLVYDYIYTKSVVFQTRGGIILRCISQASFLSSFLLFAVGRNQRYSWIDTAITYALFVGGFSLEVFALFTTVVSSPWTWAWLEARLHCSFVASIMIRWQRKRVLYSYSMGQYDLGKCFFARQPSSWGRRVMDRIRKVVEKPCGLEQKLWISKQLDIEFVEVDQEIIWCIFQKVIELADESELPLQQRRQQQWPNLGAVLQKLLPTDEGTLNWYAIPGLYVYTAAQLRMYSPSPDDTDGESTRVMVRKLSNYVAYLMATQLGMLPVRKTANTTPGEIDKALFFAAERLGNNKYSATDEFLRVASDFLIERKVKPPGGCTKEELLETKAVWINLLIFIAGRSRPEMHAAQLARGGELLTFVWLFMAYKHIGDLVFHRVEITDPQAQIPKENMRGRNNDTVLFHLPPLQPAEQQTSI